MNTSVSNWRMLPDSTGYYSNVPSFEERSQLGKDAFLKILVAQLKNQDPMEPLQDREFIAQMTQFSTLEQITNLSTAMVSFLEFQMGGSLAQHSNMIGQKVYWEMRNSSGELISGSGIVTAVSFKDGEIFVELDNGLKVSALDIYRMEAVSNDQGPVEEPPVGEPIEDDESIEDDEPIEEVPVDEVDEEEPEDNEQGEDESDNNEVVEE